MSRIDFRRSPFLCANGGPLKCRRICDKCWKIHKERENEKEKTNSKKKGS